MARKLWLTRFAPLLIMMAVVGTLGSFASLPALNVPASAQSTFEVVASNLNNPRKLAFGPDGALYVAEAGRGGTGEDNRCFQGAEGNVCYGPTGGVTRVEIGGETFTQTQVVTGMASLANPETGGNGTGPHDIGWTADGQLLVLTGLGANPLSRTVDGPLGDVALNFGQLVLVHENGSWENIVDVAAYEGSANPAGDTVDSNPFALAVEATRTLVADAGGNDVLTIEALTGTITTTAIFASRMVSHPVTPTIQLPMQAVPTTLERGPDGAYYVAELTGFPFPKGGAQIYRLVPGEEPEVHMTGFTNIMDLAFDEMGNLYVLEMTTNGLLSGVPTGAVIRVSPRGTRDVIASEGLFMPTGMTVGPDGKVYVSNYGPFPANGQPSGGQVIRITPQWNLYLPITTR